MYRVLASAVNHPDSAFPYRGLFNHRSLDALAAAGPELDVVSPRPFAPPVGPYSEFSSLPTAEPWGAYQVHRPRFWYLLPKRLCYGLSGRSFAKRVSAYAEEHFEEPDVAHACHIYLDGYGLLPYVREHDVPLFVVAHGTVLNTFGEQPASVQSKVKETLDAATEVLCVSDALAEAASSMVPGTTVSTVPIGADPSKFPVDRSPAIRDELGIDEDAMVVLFVGRFSEAKGVEEILEVLPSVQSSAIEFVFVGHGGDMRENIERTLAATGQPTRHVRWKLPPLAVRRLFAASDILLLPSHSEGRPTVIYEAMASETAVLASAVGGIPEQVNDGETGVLIPPEDPTTLEGALRSLVNDPDRVRRMGERGKDRLLEKGWTWDEHACRLRNRHQEALR